MSGLPLFIIGTTTLFAVYLVIQSLTKIKICAVCAAISTTWVILLSMRLLGFTIDPLVVGVLMGESVVGLYSLLEKKAPKSWELFRWPYIVTMTVGVYMVVGVRQHVVLAVLFLTLIWSIYAVIYTFQRYPSVKKVMERLIACCRNW